VGAIAAIAILGLSGLVPSESGSGAGGARLPAASSGPVGEEMSRAEAALSLGLGPARERALCVAGRTSTATACGDGASTGNSTFFDYPSHRWGAEITYDAADGYPLLYGGQSDTWAFENGYWVDLDPRVLPPITSFACLAYDWRDGYVVLFGGERGGIGTPTTIRDTTWSFRGGVWTNLTNPLDSPPGLAYPSCTYDSADGYVLLFGGAMATGPGTTGRSGPTIDSSDQTWEFQGGTWTNLTNPAAPHPSARFGANMADDDSTGYVVLYGGAVNGTSTANGGCTPAECPHLDDTWSFSGGRWTNITASASPNGTPTGRWEAGFANDSADGELVIIGGQANGYKSYNATGNYTWAFEDGIWKNLSGALASAPSSRFGEAMGYDPLTRSVLLFSGLNCTLGKATLWNTTWEFTDGSWTELSYLASFNETGLPANTTWGVSVTPQNGPELNFTGSSPDLVLGWTTGSYGYSVATVAGYEVTSGNPDGNLSPATPDFDIGWSPSANLVEFTETGLRAAWKATWTVELNGSTRHTRGSSLTFASLPPGSYAFRILAVANYSLNRSYTGSVTVGGGTSATTVVALHWTLITYRVVFHESGLPVHTDWNVTFNGIARSSKTTTITFAVSNGTYAFTPAAPGFTAAPPQGTVSVDGKATTQSIAFAPVSSPAGVPSIEGRVAPLLGRITGS
jgi:hypothetical protein